MKAMVCELCGSNDFVKQDNYFVCQHCRTKYTLEDAKKLLGTVKIDTSEELDKLYTIARRAKDDDNAESAVKYYEQILAMDPMSWEATFYVVYFRATQSKIAQIQSAAISVTNSLGSVLTLIQKHVDTEKTQLEAVTEVCDRVITLASILLRSAKEFFNGINSRIQGEYVLEYRDNLIAVSNLDFVLGDLINSTFEGDSYKTLSVLAWKAGLIAHLSRISVDEETIDEYQEKICSAFPNESSNEQRFKMAVAELTNGNHTAARVAFQHLKSDVFYNALAVLGLGVLSKDSKSFHEAERLMDNSVKEKYREQIKQMMSVNTPLIIASSALDVQSVRFLLSLGADVDERDTYNTTALWNVANHIAPTDTELVAMVEITKILLDAGADTNVAAPNGRQVINRFVPKPIRKLILEKNPSTKSGLSNKKGCFVATAVYGSYDCPEVWTLRRFRDDMLAETWYGRAFIRIYYAISPTLVKWFGKKIWFKNLWKPSLDKLVLKLNKAGLEDTPYQDKQW